MKKLIILGLASIATAAVGAYGVLNFNGGDSSFAPIMNKKYATMPSNTRRVWVVDNNGSSPQTDWWSSSTMYAHVWHGGNVLDLELVHEVLPGYRNGLWYFDVTLEGATTSLDVILRVGDDKGAYNWGNNNQTGTLSLGAFGSLDTIWLNDGVFSDGGRNSRNASLGATDGFSAADLATILAGYNTCSETNTYGYNAYPQLEANFFDKCSDEVKNSSATLADYDYEEYVAQGKDYSKVNKDHTSTIKDKIAGLEYWYSLNN